MEENEDKKELDYHENQLKIKEDHLRWFSLYPAWM